MKQRFFVDSIESSFIKNLLHNTPLPIFNTIREADYLFEGKFYIYKRQVLKCTGSGYFMQVPEGQVLGGTIASTEFISDYVFGKELTQFTERFSSKYSYYDTETHEALGKYLRCYRDIYGIDLMPFYNCYSGRYFSGYKIKSDGIYEDINDTAYKIYQIPIKFNKTYTIGIDSEHMIYYCPAFIKGNSFIELELAGEKFDLTEAFLYAAYESGNGLLLKSKHSTSFVRPFTFSIDTSDLQTDYLNGADIANYEKDLYLLLQVASDNESSLVVFEGDYTKPLDQRRMAWLNNVAGESTGADDFDWITTLSKKYNPEYVNELSDEKLNSLMTTKLSLNQFSDNIRYPFADRLIEYLLLNVITSEEDIPDNIKRVQYSTSLVNEEHLIADDVWDNILRDYLNQYAGTNRLTRFLDMNGFVDKDVEKSLGSN